MPLRDLTEPTAADKIVNFGEGGQTPASRIDYDVPLPGAHPITRVVPIELPDEWFADGSRSAGSSLVQLGIVEGDENALQSIRADRLAAFYRRVLPATARPALRLVADVGGDVEPLLTDATAPRTNAEGLRSMAADDSSALDVLERRRIVAEPDDVDRQRRRKDSYIEKLAQQQVESLPPRAANVAPPMITLPVPGPGQSVHEIQVDPVAPPVPRLALVETWELRSHLGDYGLGRTLQTFSLLPGERTTITVETWRSESATRDDASSIFDSSDSAAQTRFASSLSTESGAAFQDQGGWSLSVGTSASASGNFFGIVQGSASIEAGFAANHQEASQRWSNDVSQSASDHAQQANNSRRQAVQASSTTTSESGSATTTVRELANTNLRRVLNFVFRELNQSYDTYVVLRDIRLAFYNGRPGSVEIVPLTDLRRFVTAHVPPAHQDDAARFLLAMCAQRLSYDNDLVTVLEVGTRSNGSYEWNPAELDGAGELDFPRSPLSTDYRWRFAPGPLSGSDAPHDVDGLITQRSNVVLRTDNMVVEALLGQADALDPYATALQALDLHARDADIEWRKTDIERVEAALSIIRAQAGAAQVDAYARLLGDQPDISVVPAAAVTPNGSP